MHANNLRVDKCLAMAAGAGLYWGASMLLSSVWWAGAAVFGEPSFFDSFATMVSLLLVCGALAWSKLFKRKGLQRCLALSGVGFFFLSALYSSIVPSGWEGSPIVLLSLQGWSNGLLYCLLGVWVLPVWTSARAEKTVLISLVVACAVYGSGKSGASRVGWRFPCGCFKVPGDASLPFGAIRHGCGRACTAAGELFAAQAFFASRFFFGVCNGCASCALVFCARSLPNASAALCVVLTCIVLGLGLWCSTRLWWATSILRVAPLLAAGVLVFPYLANGSVVDVLAASSPRRHLLVVDHAFFGSAFGHKGAHRMGRAEAVVCGKGDLPGAALWWPIWPCFLFAAHWMQMLCPILRGTFKWHPCMLRS